MNTRSLSVKNPDPVLRGTYHKDGETMVIHRPYRTVHMGSSGYGPVWTRHPSVDRGRAFH